MKPIKNIFTTPGYCPLIMARTCSSVAIWLDFTLIFSLLSFSFQATPFSIGIATALYGIPGLILGPWMGAACDRYSPTLILFLCSSLGAILSFLLYASGSVQLFIAIVFLKGITNLGAFPAEQILIRRLLSDDQMVFTTRLITLIDQISKIFSPLVAGMFVQFIHSNHSFFLSALLEVAVAICAIAIGQIVGWKMNIHSSGRWKQNFRAVVTLFRKDINLALPLFFVVVMALILGLHDSMLAALLKEKGQPAGSFGIIVSCTAVGAIVCTVVLKSLLPIVKGSSMMFICLCGFSGTILAAGFAALIFDHIMLFPLCILWIINGFCYAGVSMIYVIYLQRSCPEALLGTVLSGGRSLQLGALVLSQIIGSLVAKAIGIPSTFFGVGVFGIILAIISLFIKQTVLLRQAYWD